MHSRFSTLLWLEELIAEGELKEFTINGAFLRKGAGSLHVDVPGLAEGRPNLNIGEEALGVFVHHGWIIADVHIVSSFAQNCSAGDRIVLKKPRSDGVVMEYVSYVTEVGRYLILKPLLFSS